MSADSKIAWTDHTYNAWWGCFKVSPGCANCYAETFSKRTGHSVWGPPATTSRRFFGEKHWQEPVTWNREAATSGVRKLVFSASMSDVFEDHPEVGPHRDRLFRLIEQTPNLDWQLLTKRPENVNRMIPATWHAAPPPNWWQGTSVENQQAADERIPHLPATPAAVRFLSCEPLLGAVDLSGWLGVLVPNGVGGSVVFDSNGSTTHPRSLHWVIVGGESGAGHRTMDLAWLESIVRQCQEAGVAVFAKQDSGQYPGKQGRIPDELLVREYPAVAAAGAAS